MLGIIVYIPAQFFYQPSFNNIVVLANVLFVMIILILIDLIIKTSYKLNEPLNSFLLTEDKIVYENEMISNYNKSLNSSYSTIQEFYDNSRYFTILTSMIFLVSIMNLIPFLTLNNVYNAYLNSKITSYNSYFWFLNYSSFCGYFVSIRNFFVQFRFPF